MTEPSPVYILHGQEQARLAPHSIEATRNAKGDLQWSIKVYYADGEQEHALETVTILDRILRAYAAGEVAPTLEEALAASLKAVEGSK